MNKVHLLLRYFFVWKVTKENKSNAEKYGGEETAAATETNKKTMQRLQGRVTVMPLSYNTYTD